MGALLFLAFVAGIFVPMQAGINAQLARHIGHPILASLVSFIVGSATLCIVSLLVGIRWPAPSQLSSVPAWVWFGGILGAFFVTATTLTAPRLGAATMLSLVIAGQMCATLLLDHYGLIGFPVHPISLWRLCGIALVVAGVCLIQRF
jgi:transporter family-2 protein